MTDQLNSLPSLMGTTVQEIVSNAFRLGLTWRLRPGTVTVATSETSLEVRLDGDDTAVTVVSMIGSIAVGRRVYVITIPPAGNYAIGAVSAHFPGERIATTTRTSASAAFTAETLLDSVTANLVIGRIYRIVWHGRAQSTVADGYARARIREDSLTGTQLQLAQVITSPAAAQSFPLMMETQFTAISTGSKTFVATMARQAGTGNVSSFAATDTPTYLYVEYVSG